MARLNRGRLVPHRLSPDDRRAAGVAADLCELYAAHVGRPRSGLEAELAAREEELGPGLDPRRGFRIVRALAKLLEERAGWTSPTEADPYTLRTRIFELASALPEPPAGEPGLLELPTRQDVLSRVSAETGVEAPAELMYADRQGAQLLVDFDRPSPEELLRRYNVAQVQGVLYAARELVVELGAGADARLVFHYVKLLGLIHDLEPLEDGAGFRLRLDGPLSIFGGTRKYGLRLAKFLPGLLLTSPWRLSAEVEWKDRDATLELDSESSGLESHYLGPKGERDADDVRAALVRAWERAKDTEGWELEPGGGVLSFPERKAALVPDFTLRRAGEVVYLEILGFWSERNLIERVALLREAGERGHRVLVAASERLGASREALDEAVEGGVIPFKDRLAAKAVLAALR